MTKKPHKYIHLNLADGRIYRIEAHKIAHDRAWTYVSQARNGGAEYREEYDSAICSEESLNDWLENNMNWYELEPVLIQTNVPELKKAEVISKDFFHETEQETAEREEKMLNELRKQRGY